MIIEATVMNSLCQVKANKQGMKLFYTRYEWVGFTIGNEGGRGGFGPPLKNIHCQPFMTPFIVSDELNG